MMIDLPSSDQASSEGPALIPIVGNNTERGGGSVLSDQLIYFQTQNIYATSVKENRVYMQLQIRKPAYTMRTYNLIYLTDADH